MTIERLDRRLRVWVAVVSGLGFCSIAQAQVTVDRAWARSTVPNQTATGAFMRITAQKDVRLMGAQSPVAGVVEVHRMAIENGVMTMRPAGEVALRAGQSVELKSGGLHLMLMNLKQQLKSGETVPVTLEFKAADGSVSRVQVKAVAALAAPAR